MTISQQQCQHMEQKTAGRLSKFEAMEDKADGHISDLQSEMSELTATVPVFVTSKQVPMQDTGTADFGVG